MDGTGNDSAHWKKGMKDSYQWLHSYVKSRDWKHTDLRGGAGASKLFLRLARTLVVLSGRWEGVDTELWWCDRREHLVTLQSCSRLLVTDDMKT